MNPLVFMILSAERELEKHNQARQMQEPEVDINRPAPHPKEKERKWFFHRLRHNKSCKCS